MDKKYELTSDSVKVDGHTLYRIRTIKDLSYVNAGRLGGYVESENNLSHGGDCWIYENAIVYGNAFVYENAQVWGHARVCGHAEVFGEARVSGDAQVCGNAWVFGDARVYGNARVHGYARVCKNAHVYENAQICGNTWSWGDIYGDAWVGPLREQTPIAIHGNIKINHGIWTRYIKIDDIWYLMSSTLEKMPVG